MELLIFKTNIQYKKNLKAVKKLFNAEPTIADWSVDIEDIDKVMRVESLGTLSEQDIIMLVNKLGLECESLAD